MDPRLRRILDSPIHDVSRTRSSSSMQFADFFSATSPTSCSPWLSRRGKFQIRDVLFLPIILERSPEHITAKSTFKDQELTGKEHRMYSCRYQRVSSSFRYFTKRDADNKKDISPTLMWTSIKTYALCASEQCCRKERTRIYSPQRRRARGYTHISSSS